MGSEIQHPKDLIWYHVVVLNSGKHDFIPYRMNEEDAIYLATRLARLLNCEAMIVKSVGAIRPGESFTLKIMEEKSTKVDEYLTQFINDFNDDELPF